MCVYREREGRPSCNGYRFGELIQRPEFKTCTWLFSFYHWERYASNSYISSLG